MAFAPLNPAYTDDEAAAALEYLRPQFLIVDRAHAERAEQLVAGRDTILVTVGGDGRRPRCRPERAGPRRFARRPSRAASRRGRHLHHLPDQREHRPAQGGDGLPTGDLVAHPRRRGRPLDDGRRGRGRHVPAVPHGRVELRHDGLVGPARRPPGPPGRRRAAAGRRRAVVAVGCSTASPPCGAGSSTATGRGHQQRRVGADRDVAGDPGAAGRDQGAVPRPPARRSTTGRPRRPGPSPCATPTCSPNPAASAIPIPGVQARVADDGELLIPSDRLMSRVLRASRRDGGGAAGRLVPHRATWPSRTTRATCTSSAARRRSSAPEARRSPRSRSKRRWRAIPASPTWRSSASPTPSGARWCAPSSCWHDGRRGAQRGGPAGPHRRPFGPLQAPT